MSSTARTLSIRTQNKKPRDLRLDGSSRAKVRVEQGEKEFAHLNNTIVWSNSRTRALGAFGKWETAAGRRTNERQSFWT